MFAELIRRAKYILSAKGLLSLIKHTFSYCFSYIFRFDTFGIRIHFPQIAGRIDAVKISPRVASHEFFIVEDNNEADELERKGYEFRSQVFMAGEALDHGGTALVVFVDREVAGIIWVARNQKVQRILDDPPGKIDFISGEALISGAVTFPKYRQQGIYAYILFKTLEYLAYTGNQKTISFTPRGLPIYGISEKLFGSKLAGIGYRLRIFGLQFFWERPAASN